MADTATKIPFAEAAAPSTPASGKVVVYAKADGLIYSKDDAGTETLMSSGPGGGSVATDAIWDAKGDLAGGTGANTAAKLTAGANGTVLTAASGETTGLIWAVPSMVRIAQTVLGSDTANFTFAAIAGTYESLMVVMTVRSDRVNATDYVAVQFNADTGANYNYSNWDAAPTNSPSTGQTALVAAPIPAASATAGRAGGVRILIPNYARTTFHKTALCEGVNAAVASKQAGDWANTAAITQVLLKPLVGSNFKTGSVATLYGIT